MANTDTSSCQGHLPPRTTAKEVAQQESMNKLLVNKRNRTGAHSDNKRDSNRGDIHDEEEENAELDIFEGVTYKRKARYYLAGIGPRST